MEFGILSSFSIFLFYYLLKSSIFSQNGSLFWAIYIFLVSLFILSLIPLYLSLTYIIEDINKTVQFDFTNKVIVIKKKGKITTIKKDEIIAAYQVMVNMYSGARNSLPWFKYLLIIKNERERICITNLICDPEDVLSFLKIKYKTIYWNIPIISRAIGSEFLTNVEFKEKVKEFEEEYQNYSREQLEEIVSKKEIYTEYARQAASELLKKII